MKAIMVMFDSLNRHFLPPYGCDWVKAPNFKRLAERAVTFDKSFVGSMPCMPARRELHTGRYNFLHRSWGPLEPFDDSMPELLKNAGILTHLVSDHYHYWEEGGANYHTKYSTWQISRGQEGDPFYPYLKQPDIPHPNPKREQSIHAMRDWHNRGQMQLEKEQPQPKTFAMGTDFIRKFQDVDNWLLHIETFDPHEPYYVPEKYKALYDFDFSKFTDDWPGYCPIGENRELTEHYRYLNAALVSMCDEYLGKVLDLMDQFNLWKDTLLIVNTDHGFLLGEHDYWGKCMMPFYNEIAQTPFFVWDPRIAIANERRDALVQTIDIAPTLLEFFGVEIPKDMQGKPLKDTILNNTPIREAGLFGLHGAHVNVTDGRYVYMRAPVTKDNKPLFNYTHMPVHMRSSFRTEEMQTMELAPPFEFTKGCPTMKLDANKWVNYHDFGDLLFDIDEDPGQTCPLDDPEIKAAMKEKLKTAMVANNTPQEQFVRLGLEETEIQQ